MAFQSVISILVAAAVGWHTVAGCCAHHAHAATHPSPADSSATCCDHGAPAHSGRDSQAVDHTESSGDEHAAGSVKVQPTAPEHCPQSGLVGNHGRPGGSPADCSESRCAFVASGASSWQVLDALADYPADSLFTESTAIAALRLAPTLRRQRHSELSGIFFGNATRRHLALSILLL